MRLTLTLIFSILIFITSCEKSENDNEPVTGIKVGNFAPNFSLPDTIGVNKSLIDYKGDLILIEFWASWCPYCNDAHPIIKDLYEEHKRSGFKVIAISLDTSRKGWINKIKSASLPFIHISDLMGFDSPVAKTYEIGGIPRFVLIDETGKILLNVNTAEKVVDYMNNLHF